MILPIFAYGHKVLRTKAKPVPADYPNLAQLVADMYETMYNASGVGLAAPQVGLDLRLFIVDANPMEDPATDGFKQVFINPQMLEETGTPWAYEEGCLSIPGIREDVLRPPSILIKYQDENLAWHEQRYEGLAARVVQHEYDHIEGKLFTDYMTPLRKRLLKNKLAGISKGDCDARYRMNFPLR